jgi:hypothetical protein
MMVGEITISDRAAEKIQVLPFTTIELLTQIESLQVERKNLTFS